MNFMQDMTKGSPFKLLLSFSIPLLIGSLFQQFYTMADSIIVGKFVGADALASIGACSSVIYLLFSLFLGLSAGIGIVISQYFGAGDGSTDDVAPRLGVTAVALHSEAHDAVPLHVKRDGGHLTGRWRRWSPWCRADDGPDACGNPSWACT